MAHRGVLAGIQDRSLTLAKKSGARHRRRPLVSAPAPAAAAVSAPPHDRRPLFTQGRPGSLVASAGAANRAGLMVSSRAFHDHSGGDAALHHQTGLIP
jgi:hypothetical protein